MGIISGKLKRLQMSLRDVKEEMGIPIATLSRAARGRDISFRSAVRICNALGLSISELAKEYTQSTVQEGFDAKDNS